MTAFLEITDAQVQPEAPVTSALLTQLRDNPIAVAEGDPSVPIANRAGWMHVTSRTISGSGEAFDFSALNANVHAIKIFVIGARPDTDNDDLVMGTSSNSGVSYDGGAGNYRWSLVEVDSATSAIDGVYDDSAAFIALTDFVGTSTTESLNLEITLWDFQDANKYTQASWHGTWIDGGGVTHAVNGSGARLSAGVVDAFILAWASGGFETTGQIVVKGLISFP